MGYPGKADCWLTAHQMDEAVNALHVATVGAVAYGELVMRWAAGSLPLIGAGTEARFHTYLGYRISLPEYNPNMSSYDWAVYVYENGSAPKYLVVKGSGVEDGEYLDGSKKSSSDGRGLEHKIVKDRAERRSREIRGHVKMEGYANVRGVEVLVDYWINREVDQKALKIYFRTS